MRTVICHYHIYKNSGTSFDELLTKNFSEKHICFDGPFPFFSIDQEQLARIIERRPLVQAFSSHQIQLPVPASLDYLVLPIVFVRHPLLRIQSIYNFKRRGNDGTVTSENARTMDLNDWIKQCFSDPQEITQITNSQTRMLGCVYRQRPQMRRKPSHIEYDENQALRNLDAVSLVARTDYFDHDVSRFPRILEQHGVKFEYSKTRPKNATSKNLHVPIEEKLAELEELIEPKIYNRLVDANRQDLRIFEHVSRRLATSA